jgi:Holliday junction resolvasome RuvABC endonuclease subunit
MVGRVLGFKTKLKVRRDKHVITAQKYNIVIEFTEYGTQRSASVVGAVRSIYVAFVGIGKINKKQYRYSIVNILTVNGISVETDEISGSYANDELNLAIYSFSLHVSSGYRIVEIPFKLAF